MNLLDLYEDLFLEICDLNRIGRNGGQRDYEQVRADIKARLQEIARKAKGQAHLEAQVEKLELPILCFIDSMIAESRLNFARQWHLNRLAFEKNQRAGDQKFFELLQETLDDDKEEARERLAIFYTCLGLGFTGAYAGNPPALQNIMSQVMEKLGEVKDFAPNARVCQGAYDHVDKRNLVDPPSRKLWVLALVFLCFTLAAALSYVWMFDAASQDLSKSIDTITNIKP